MGIGGHGDDESLGEADSVFDFHAEHGVEVAFDSRRGPQAALGLDGAQVLAVRRVSVQQHADAAIKEVSGERAAAVARADDGDGSVHGMPLCLGEAQPTTGARSWALYALSRPQQHDRCM